MSFLDSMKTLSRYFAVNNIRHPAITIWAADRSELDRICTTITSELNAALTTPIPHTDQNEVVEVLGSIYGITVAVQITPKGRAA